MENPYCSCEPPAGHGLQLQSPVESPDCGCELTTRVSCRGKPLDAGGAIEPPHAGAAGPEAVRQNSLQLQPPLMIPTAAVGGVAVAYSCNPH